MEPDATYKYLHSSAVMVEDLMHWLVAERHGMHALVEALDFDTLARVHEQSVDRRRRGAAPAQQRHGLAGASARARRRR